MLEVDPEKRIKASEILMETIIKNEVIPECKKTFTTELNESNVILKKLQNFKETSKFKKIVI